MGDIKEGSAPPAENEVTPKPEATPPATANVAPVVKESSEPKSVPYPRFKELIDKKNDLESRLKKLEERVPAPDESQKHTEAAVKRLVEKGMEEESAKELVATQLQVAKAAADERIAPVEEAASKREVEKWFADFKDAHKDYDALEPEMFKAYATLSPAVQTMLAADPRGVQLLYDHVKVKQLETEAAAKYEQGTKDGYQNKQLKEAMSTEPAASPKGIPSRKDIAAMSLEDYRKVREDLLKPETLKTIAKSQSQ